MLLSRSWQCGGAVWLAILVGLTLQESRRSSDHSQQQQQQQSQRSQQQRGGRGEESNVKSGRPPRQTIVKTPRRTSEKPNIVFIITDDQDVELGSLNFMPKTARAVRDQGATFVNAFCTTPMCCPSRSSMLTGMYVHNHNVYTNNDNCSSEQWRQTHEIHNFATYLSNAGYRTGYFGKYLNEYTGAYIPPGWTEWLGLIRNTRFYNYTLNYNGQKIKHEDNYQKDYLTDVIANESVRFLQESKRYHPNRPVAMVLAMPAPHGPEDAAPQYQHLFMEVKSHRTPSWNFAPNPDKQWLLQYTGKMSPIQIAFTDILQTKRLQTLQSVDDAVEKVVKALEDLDELDNTYIIYTSDHGYHLGQYGLVKGKAMPYDFDIRVPFYIRGPKINPGIRVSSIVLNLDIAPTLLDIAGIPAPDHMDGSSVLKLFDAQPDSLSSVRRRRAWRDTFLVERGKLTHRKLKVQEKLEAHFNRLVTTKEQRLEEECQKVEYHPPCKPGQQLECRRNEHGKLRIYKCRSDNGTVVGQTTKLTRCNCQKEHGSSSLDREMDAEEIQRQLDFLQHHVNQPRMVEPKFISERIRRDVRKMHKHRKGFSTASPVVTKLDTENINDTSGHVKFGQADDVTNEYYDVHRATDALLSEHWIPVQSGDGNTEIPCRLNANGTVVCERYVYSSVHEWIKQKAAVESIINNYRRRVSVLESIQKHLIESEPTTKQHDRHRVSTMSPVTTVPMVTTTTRESEHMFNVTSEDHDGGSTISDENDVEDEETEDEDSDTEEEHGSSFVDESLCTCDDDNDDETSNPRLSTNKNKMTSSKLEMLARDVASQEERDNHRRQKMEQTRLSKAHSAVGRRMRKVKSKKHRAKSSLDCDSSNGSCTEGFMSSPTTSVPVNASNSPWHGVDFTHFSSRRDPVCHIDGLECSRMDDEHWKTAPFWTHGPFCICPNSNNNTYWCLRTVNDSHNFLYCEFITGFISFYDMTRDPYQLRNAVHDLSFSILHQLHDTLEMMKGCKGSRKCNTRSKLANVDIDEPRENIKHVRQDGRVTKVNDQHADSARSKWLRTKGVRLG